eukprot:jgi/Ulvmu1/12345/UM089_0029.1
MQKVATGQFRRRQCQIRDASLPPCEQLNSVTQSVPDKVGMYVNMKYARSETDVAKAAPAEVLCFPLSTRRPWTLLELRSALAMLAIARHRGSGLGMLTLHKICEGSDP